MQEKLDSQRTKLDHQTKLLRVFLTESTPGSVNLNALIDFVKLGRFEKVFSVLTSQAKLEFASNGKPVPQFLEQQIFEDRSRLFAQQFVIRDKRQRNFYYKNAFNTLDMSLRLLKDTDKDHNLELANILNEAETIADPYIQALV